MLVCVIEYECSICTMSRIKFCENPMKLHNFMTHFTGCNILLLLFIECYKILLPTKIITIANMMQHSLVLFLSTTLPSWSESIYLCNFTPSSETYHIQVHSLQQPNGSVSDLPKTSSRCKESIQPGVNQVHKGPNQLLVHHGIHQI
jgi:hypothetical protein